MIAHYFKFNNRDNKNQLLLLLISTYTKIMSSLQSGKIKCPNTKCKHHACIKYGTYTRKIILPSGSIIEIKIQRVYCKHCGYTQAIIPFFIVPYKRKTIYTISETINEYLYDSCYLKEDEYIIKTYKEWEEKFKTHKRDIRKVYDDYKETIIFCSTNFCMCFMQVERRAYKNHMSTYEVYYDYQHSFLESDFDMY